MVERERDGFIEEDVTMFDEQGFQHDIEVMSLGGKLQVVTKKGRKQGGFWRRK